MAIITGIFHFCVGHNVKMAHEENSWSEFTADFTGGLYPTCHQMLHYVINAVGTHPQAHFESSTKRINPQ